MNVTGRYEVNYDGGHQLDIVLMNQYEVNKALNPCSGQWNTWAVETRGCGARRIPMAIIDLDEKTRPEHLWTSLYMVARAYAYLNQGVVARAPRTEYLERAIKFCKPTLEQEDCRLRKLYVDFLKMLVWEKPIYSVTCDEQRELSYQIPYTVGIPDIETLRDFVSFLLMQPNNVQYCSGVFVPHLVLDHRVVSSYEYAKYSSMVFQQEADAILNTLAE